ncbi:unnamed protein product [Coccothraustes coccothraustes]
MHWRCDPGERCACSNATPLSARVQVSISPSSSVHINMNGLPLARGMRGFCYSFYARRNQQLDAMLHKSAGLSPETEMEPQALCRLGGVVRECRTNADRVPAGARSANRQRGGRNSVRFYGVVTATARAGARTASPRGLRAKGGTPAPRPVPRDAEAGAVLGGAAAPRELEHQSPCARRTAGSNLRESLRHQWDL